MSLILLVVNWFFRDDYLSTEQGSLATQSLRFGGEIFNESQSSPKSRSSGPIPRDLRNSA
jgi:hypothetical protein